jgi:hypothetical protein
VRLLPLLILACPAALAGPIPPEAPRFAVRLEGLFGQPTTNLGARGGGGFGLSYRITDQLWISGDAAQNAAPRGGLTAVAAGLVGVLDMTPIAPFVELSIVTVGPRDTAGYTVAARTGFGADWQVARKLLVGLVVRQSFAVDPVVDGASPGGTQAAFRLVFLPGG